MSKTRAKFPSKLAPLFDPYRYKITYGGRGGAKSWGIARALVIMAANRPLRVLCARELQKSIKDSVHQLLADQIRLLGYENAFEILTHEIRGKFIDSRFSFIGLARNYTEIKSYEGTDIAWVEEANKVTKESWDILIPTIRKENSEIWLSFNPDLEADETYQRFVVNPPSNSWVCKISWRDNPWFPDVLMQEMEDLKAKDYNEYLHIWEGDCKRIISGCWFTNAINRHQSPQKGVKGTIHERNGEFTLHEEGEGMLELWRYPIHLVEPEAQPWVDRYCIGSDIGEGLNQDYSVAYVYDRVLKEFVAKLRSNKVDSVTWSQWLMELAWYYTSYHDLGEGKYSPKMSLIVPERTGAGITTCQQLHKNNANVYSHEVPAQGGNVATKKVGWVETKSNKFALMGDFREYMESTESPIHDETLLAECGVFIHDRERGTLEAAEGYHDDCVIAAALAIQGEFYLGVKPYQIEKPITGWRKKYLHDGGSAWAA